MGVTSMEKRNKLYLQKKIFAYYSIIIISIILISFLVFYAYTYKNIEENGIKHLMNINSISMDQYDTLFRDMDNMALQIIANPYIQEVFKEAKRDVSWDNYFTHDFKKRLDTIATLTSINGPNIFAHRISIYNNQGDFISTGVMPDSQTYIHNQMKKKKYRQWYNFILDLDGKRHLTPPSIDSWNKQRQKSLFTLSRELRDIDFSYGIVEIQLPYDRITQILKDKETGDPSHYLLTPTGEMAYPYSPNGPIDSTVTDYYMAHIPDSTLEGYFPITNPITDAKEIVAYSTSTMSNWILLSVQPLDTLLAPIQYMGLILLLIGCTLIIAALALISIITNHLTQPLKQLRTSINHISFKNLSIDMDQNYYSNELQLLNESFNKMLLRLENSMDEVVELKTSEMRSHILALQSQMNPHFLYNTLAVINASAIEEDYLKISKMCSKLSNILRYTSSFEEESVTLKQEFNNAKDYMALMKERFEDQLTYTFDMDSALGHISVPKLVLQPLLENCFSHGFKYKSPPWYVHIHIHASEHGWSMSVEDNGCGFDQDKLLVIQEELKAFYKQPKKKMSTMHIGGLALLNTLIRLQYYYKEDMIFHVDSDENQGTKITIGGPMHDYKSLDSRR